MAIDTWRQLVKFIEQNQGAAIVTMHRLREIAGAGRLGSTVRVMIREKLQSLDLDIIRAELPNNQEASVLIYQVDSRAGKVVRAIRRCSRGEDMEEGLEILRQLNASENPDNIKVEIFDGLKALEETIHKAEDILSS